MKISSKIGPFGRLCDPCMKTLFLTVLVGACSALSGQKIEASGCVQVPDYACTSLTEAQLVGTAKKTSQLR